MCWSFQNLSWPRVVPIKNGRSLKFGLLLSPPKKLPWFQLISAAKLQQLLLWLSEGFVPQGLIFCILFPFRVISWDSFHYMTALSMSVPSWWLWMGGIIHNYHQWAIFSTKVGGSPSSQPELIWSFCTWRWETGDASVGDGVQLMEVSCMPHYNCLHTRQKITSNLPSPETVWSWPKITMCLYGEQKPLY